MRSRGIDARRSATLESLLSPADDRVAQATAYLQSAGTARPRRTKTLANAINARLGNKLEPLEVERVIAELARRGVITVVDGKVAYQ